MDWTQQHHPGREQQGGAGALAFVQGQQNTVSGLQRFVTGYGLTSSESYARIADGSGKDVHWVQYDAAGKVKASSGPLEYSGVQSDSFPATPSISSAPPTRSVAKASTVPRRG